MSTHQFIVHSNVIPHNKKELGTYAEQKAWQYLQQQDYQLIHRNWKGKRGEIDLVLAHQKNLIWMEVRCTTQKWLIDPLQAITHQKSQQVARCAQEFMLKENKLIQEFDEFRFDVIAISLTHASPSPKQSTIQLEHVINAFYASWVF